MTCSIGGPPRSGRLLPDTPLDCSAGMLLRGAPSGRLTSLFHRGNTLSCPTPIHRRRRWRTAKRNVASGNARNWSARRRSLLQNVINSTCPTIRSGPWPNGLQATLIVPPGHPLAGQPMALPEFGRAFLADSFGAHESALCMGRKNAKSAICAVLALGYLIGPLRTPGWRGAIASISKKKHRNSATRSKLLRWHRTWT